MTIALGGLMCAITACFFFLFREMGFHAAAWLFLLYVGLVRIHIHQEMRKTQDRKV